ncbi:hypothetical protein V8E36_007304 [Tilletia maclaganii]
MTSFSSIGWIGLGNLGAPMAKNLASHLKEKHSSSLLTWNRTTSKVTDLVSSAPEGAVRPASSIEQIGQGCDLIFTSLANDTVARTVVDELLKGIGQSGRKAVIVETSTIAAETAKELSEKVSSVAGLSYVQSPAFGPPPMAVEAKLVFVVSGPREAKAAIEPYLLSMGRKTLDMGTDVSKASIFKLVGNGFIAGLVELLAETMTLANTAGVGDEALLGFIKEFVPAPSAIGYGTKMVNSAFDAAPNGFAVDGGLKDIGHILALAKQTGAKLPILETAKAHLEHVRGLEKDAGTKLDWSSLVAAQRIESGLEPWKDGRKTS